MNLLSLPVPVDDSIPEYLIISLPGKFNLGQLFSTLKQSLLLSKSRCHIDMSTDSPFTQPDDPWDWSVDQVGREFCRSDQDRPTWCSPTDHLPKPAVLEVELQENDVTGEVLLTAVTKEVLRNDLNVKSMGQRHTIEKGINYLRSRSAKFQSALANPNIAPPFTPVHSWLRTSGPPYDHPPNIGGSVQSGVPPCQTLDSPRPDLQLDNFGNSNPYSLNARGSAQTPAHVSPKDTPLAENVHNAPVDLAPPPSINRNPPNPLQHKRTVEGLRRIAPTFVAHLDDNTHHSAPSFGEDNVVVSRNESVEEVGDVREFHILGAHVGNGRRIYASRRIKKYLTVHGQEPLGARQNSSWFHVAESNHDVKSPALQERQRGRDEDNEFQYLLDKYPAKPNPEDLLPEYGDSGEDGNFDDETWHEIERDAAEDRNNTSSMRALPLPAVNSTIDEAINDFKTIWQEKRLAKVQAKGFRLWKKANRHGRVEDEVANAQYWIQRLQQSVFKIRQAIARETWPNPGAVRQQCQSLEESIFQQQEHQYNLSILRKTTAPPRPDRKSIRRENSTPVDFAEGEILLKSESELSMSNFIDESDIPPMPTALQPTTTDEVVPVQASEESEEVISPEAKRRKTKPRINAMDPIRFPFVHSESQSSATAPSSGSDSDLDRPAPLPQSKYETVGYEKSMPIDLLSSSDPPTPVEISPSDDIGINFNDDDALQPSTPTRLVLSRPQPPPLNDVEGIRQMAWETIEDASDSRRALAKAVYSLNATKVTQVWKFLELYAEENLQDVLQHGFIAIVNRLRGVEDIVKNQWGAARMTTLLFASYCLARRVLDEHYLDKEGTLKAQRLIESGKTMFLQELKRILSNFLQCQILKPNNGKRKLGDADKWQADTPTSDSDTSRNLLQTPGKKKRRHLKQSQMATSSQLAGQLRVQEQEQRMASMIQKFKNIPRNMMDPAGYAVSVEEPVIYLDPKIGGKVKAHQINGIRFMWRELMTDERKQGCLLAHTMGLGKTMQVISVLVTIAQSIESLEDGIRRQIPDDLRHLKALILCPPSLIDNWYEEILMWQPDTSVLSGLYKITQNSKRPDRVQDIAQWASTGGILIISYDMFRSLIVNKAKAGGSGDERPLSSSDHVAVQEHLLNHPNIIVADEAHKMKNTEAGISRVAARFKSTRRIALTGSPLANNLDEYFAMIDWIAPGYLGTKEQFRSKYAIPISEGLWTDSDPIDRRLSLRRLHVLKKNLDPKISRADITAIADDLSSKTEFFITVPLTKLQVKAYNLYVTALVGGDAPKISGNVKLWDWLAILSLLCCHPSTFLTKLDDRQYAHRGKPHKAKATMITSTDDAEGPGMPTDIEVANAGLSPEMVEQQRKIFRALEDSDRLEDPSLSHRSKIVCDIIELAVAAGDKILLFSHSIPTLNYLEGTVSSLGFSTCRLDGSINVTKRQEAVQNFNKETATSNVFFISTRAGGLGLNLQGANRVILFDYGFNPIWEEQAIGRAYRLGQRKPVFVYRLRSAGTFEEVIYNKAVFKTHLSARVVDRKNPMRYASKKATKYLYHVNEVPQEDLTSYYGKDPLVLDEVLGRSNCIRGITLTETFQKEEDESLTPEEIKQANAELKDEQEQRRDPIGYGRKRAQHHAALLNTRLPASLPTAGRPSLYAQRFPLRPSAPGQTQDQQFSVRPTITEEQPIGYISRPEAIRSSQQTETGFWDHRAPPHLQNRLQNVLGLPPSDNVFRNSYPSPTSERQPTEVQKAPGSPSPLGKQLDGAIDDDSADSD